MNLRKKIAYYDGNEALAFPDVYLKPAYSDIRSRFGSQIDISTQIALGCPKLTIPFISAGMDTVTEDNMATIMALNGGLGEIHRNNTPDIQAELVRKVKEHMRLMETNPPMVSDKATIKDVLNLLEKRRRGYVIVFPGEKFSGQFVGMATDRDFLSAGPDTPIIKVMTPLKSESGHQLITIKKGASLAEAVKIMYRKRLEKIPVVDEKENLIGVYSLKDFQHIKKFPNAALDSKGRLMVAAAIGVHEIDVERAHKLVEAGVDLLFLDIAHSHSIYSKEMISRLKIKEKIKTPLAVGNVATKEGVLFCYDIGADAIKVGIGPGFVCKTRNVAGNGVPQITAILEAKSALANKRNSPPIIADGGVREPGDPAKAVACGADCVMMGSVLAGTDAGPGEIIKVDGHLQKRVRGMASKRVSELRAKLGDFTTNQTLYAPEGRETYIPFQGSTQEVLYEYIGGFRSAMSYTGSRNIRELQEAQLIRISAHGSNEQGRALT